MKSQVSMNQHMAALEWLEEHIEDLITEDLDTLIALVEQATFERGA